MRFALLDNATLTGVQRLLGQIPVRNTLSLDMDMLCLETLLEAVLFYDSIAILDDYKPRYRDDRKTAFPRLVALAPDHIHYDQMLARAKLLTDGIVPRVEAGQFTDDDFTPFFELLKMNVIFTWDMASSVYYLTQKMLAGVGGLDLEKYSRLSEAIYFELVDKKRSQQTEGANGSVTLVGSDHRLAETVEYDLLPQQTSVLGVGNLSTQVKAFFAGLNWLAFRTVLYTIAATSLNADLCLHPIRHAFHVNLLTRLHPDGQATFRPLVDAMNEAANTAINRILSTTQPIVAKQPIPLFVAWFAQKVDDPRLYLEAAYELREEPPFSEARQKLIELESLPTDDPARFVAEGNRMVAEVKKSIDSILAKYHVVSSQGVPSSQLIKLWNLSTLATRLPQIPEIDVGIPQLEFLSRIRPQRSFGALYRNVVNDLTQIARLGGYYESVASRVVLDEHAGPIYAKTEEVEYRGHRSAWKIPM